MKAFFRSLLIVAILFSTYSCATLKVGGQKEQMVLVTTTEGDIKLKLYNETPLHRDNFKKLVKSKFYNGVLFHRVINDFMIQGGDPDSKTADANAKLGGGGLEHTIPAEFRTPELYHKKGALAAARTSDNVNPKKESSSCQFYIVTGKKFTDQQLDAILMNRSFRQGNADNLSFLFSEQARQDYKTIGGTPHLDGDYTVFGEVVEGLDIVDKISETETNMGDRPVKDVRILKMKLVRK